MLSRHKPSISRVLLRHLISWEIWALPAAICLSYAIDKCVLDFPGFYETWLYVSGSIFIGLFNSVYAYLSPEQIAFTDYFTDTILASDQSQQIYNRHIDKQSLLHAFFYALIGCIIFGGVVKKVFDVDARIPIISTLSESFFKEFHRDMREIAQMDPIHYNNYGTIIGPQLVKDPYNCLECIPSIGDATSDGISVIRWNYPGFIYHISKGSEEEYINHKVQATNILLNYYKSAEYLEYNIFTTNTNLLPSRLLRLWAVQNLLASENLINNPGVKVVQINFKQYIQSYGFMLSHNSVSWVARQSVGAKFDYIDLEDVKTKQYNEIYFEIPIPLQPSIIYTCYSALRGSFGFCESEIRSMINSPQLSEYKHYF
jgi:hypothetical protein